MNPYEAAWECQYEAGWECQIHIRRAFGAWGDRVSALGVRPT
jgi:hypothetical protein